jgi:hypothetical protein
MAAEEKPARGTIATVVATAAVTLAIGVTAAALGGYLVPAGSGGGTTPEQAAEPSAVEPQRAAPPNAPSVVLVPVAPDSRAEPPTMPAAPPEVFLAAYEPTGHDDDDDDDHDEGHHGRHR